MQSTDSLRELNAKLLAEIAKPRKENIKIPKEKLLRFAEVKAENTKLKQIIEENAKHNSENIELKSRVEKLEARLALLEQSSTVDRIALSFDKLNNENVTKIPEVTGMLTSKQDEQDLSQSYEASSENIRSASCVLSKQPQVNASKLACNLKNREDFS
ncbi:hypothetical protein C1646_767987 [Rhizophagus diaphanus]|nr:hypothetical protein C1646_767987 [Rhizophagus diaphanus] [Rhizophagus sp. MUCL 43196]